MRLRSFGLFTIFFILLLTCVDYLWIFAFVFCARAYFSAIVWADEKSAVIGFGHKLIGSQICINGRWRTSVRVIRCGEISFTLKVTNQLAQLHQFNHEICPADDSNENSCDWAQISRTFDGENLIFMRCCCVLLCSVETNKTISLVVPCEPFPSPTLQTA